MEEKILCNQLIDLIKGIFPGQANFYTWYDSSKLSCLCRISWKLNDDSKRPNKTSKIILLIISQEAIDDYRDSTPLKQQEAQKFFKNFIQNKYNQFDPNHDVPKNQSPPTEEWLVTTEHINK